MKGKINLFLQNNSDAAHADKMISKLDQALEQTIMQLQTLKSQIII